MQSGPVTFRQATVADRKPILRDILTCFGKQNGTATGIIKVAAAAAVAAGAGGGAKRARQTMGGEGGWGGGVGGGIGGGGLIGVMDRLGPVFSSGRDLDAPEESGANSSAPLRLPLPGSLPLSIPLPVPAPMGVPAVDTPLPAVTSSGITVTAPESVSLPETEGLGQAEGEGEGGDLRDRLRRGSGSGSGNATVTGKGERYGGATVTDRARVPLSERISLPDRVSLSETEAEEGEAVDLRDTLKRAQFRGDLRDRLSRRAEDRAGKGETGGSQGALKKGDSVGDLRELLKKKGKGGDGWDIGSASVGHLRGAPGGGGGDSAGRPARKFKGRGNRLFERSLANMQASTTDDI